VPHSSFGTDMPDLNNWGVIRETDGVWLAHGREKLLRASDMIIFGEHNIANALAALALGKAVNIPMDAMLATLREFPGLPHRCQLVARENGVSWYNDSKGTNVGATLAALNGLGPAITGKVILIAGGQGKGQDFSPLSPAMLEFGKLTVLMGEDALAIDAVLAPEVKRIHVASLQEAVAVAAQAASGGDAVLLSPACASFDMFKNYEDRGHRFVALVKQQAEAA